MVNSDLLALPAQDGIAPSSTVATLPKLPQPWYRWTVRPAWQTALLLCVGQVVLWSLAFWLTYTSLEVDSAEQFAWAFSLENGYWKHPPVPSWIMYGLLQVFGPSLVLPLVAAQASIAIALLLTWRLACAFMSPQRALVAMALTSLVAYHNVGGDNFNHSTALLPFQAAMVLVFYRATRSGNLWLWALTGLFAALSMLVKYVAIMPIAGLVLYLVLDRAMHQRRTLLGLAVAAGVFVLLLVPHAIWLESTNFLPFQYARTMTQPMAGWWPGLRGLLGFLGIQLLRVLPMLLGLGFVLLPLRGALRAPPCAPAPAGDRLFLWVTTLSPLVLTLVYAVVTRTALQPRWGTNAFLTIGVLAMALVRTGDSPRLLGRTLYCTVAVHLVLCLSMTLGRTVVAEHFHWRTRVNFPGPLLARNAMAVWHAETNVPLRLVVSDVWLGGTVVANTPQQRIAVLIDGYFFKSPWINEETLQNCGALVLDDQTRGATGAVDNAAVLNGLMARASVTGMWTIPWADTHAPDPTRSAAVVRWGVILPSAAGACKIR
jgi:hypothetical protein